MYTKQSFENNKLLHVNSQRTRIVQKAIYLVLLEIYENKLRYFSTHSHGFRPGKNKHSALHEIKFGWQAINWYLKFDLKKVFYLIKQKTFVKLLKANIHDKALFSLLQHMLQAEVFSKEKTRLFYSKTYFHYNNLLTLFLSQIYLSPLDSYARNLSKEYSIGKKSFANGISRKLDLLTKKRIIPLFSDDLSTQPELTNPSCLNKLPLSYTGIPIKIKHVRYANDFIFGILSNKK